MSCGHSLLGEQRFGKAGTQGLWWGIWYTGDMIPLVRGSRTYRDPSFWTLLAANGFAIFLAITQRWALETVLWVYWGQSVAIGVVGLFHLLVGSTKTEYGRGWLDSLGRFIENLFSALFFTFHYGVFHGIYAWFLNGFFPGAWRIMAEPLVLTGIAAFFLHHLYSFFYHRWKPVQGAPEFDPYLRIIPMHFMLLAIPVFGGSVTIFLLLRTAVDLLSHVYGYRTGGKGR